MTSNTRQPAQFFRVVDLEKRQHYQNRTPPWIKLHRERLEEYTFGSLPDNAKAHLLMIELLASRMDNRVPYDSSWVGKKINARSRVDLDLLMSQGFIEPLASTLLSDRTQTASPEGEGEAKREEEESGPVQTAASAPASPVGVVSPPQNGNGTASEDDVALVFQTWKDTMPGKKEQTLTPDRRRSIEGALTGKSKGFGQAYPIAVLLDAVRWAPRDPRTTNTGKYKDAEPRDDIKDILAFPDKIERFSATWRKRSMPPVAPIKSRDTLLGTEDARRIMQQLREAAREAEKRKEPEAPDRAA